MQRYEPTQPDAIEPGWDLIGSDDRRIGPVTDVGPGYVKASKGMLFPKDIYVPLTAVTQADPAGRTVLINVPKSSIDDMDWSEPPVAPTVAEESEPPALPR
jgi:hypothetical protein